MKNLYKFILTSSVAVCALAVTLLTGACDGEEKFYTLTFETDGGTAIEAITARAGEAIVPPADPVKGGFEFDGWYEEGSPAGVELPTVMPERDIVYYASYAQLYTVTFVTGAGATKIEPVTGRAGSAVSAPEDPVLSGSKFAGWFTDPACEGEPVEIVSVMPAQNITYYASFSRRYTVVYSFNLEDENGNTVAYTGTTERATGAEGDEITVAQCGYEAAGYRFLGWSTERDGLVYLTGTPAEGQYMPEDKIVLGSENVFLYAQWAREYTDALEKNPDKIYIAVKNLGRQGKGEAILVRGGADILGFAEEDETNGCIGFDFTFDDETAAEGRAYADGTYLLRDGTQGSYLGYDRIEEKAAGYILTTDGYGYATISSLAGDQIKTEHFGLYVYNDEFDDYAFYFYNTDGNPIVDDYGYPVGTAFRLENGQAGGQFKGYWIEQGAECGYFQLYGNGEFSNYLLFLDGYGNAELWEIDAQTGELTYVSARGEYVPTDAYESAAGEWEFRTSSSYGDFQFILNYVLDTDGSYIPVYIGRNAAYFGTYQEENGGGTLYLDGYGGAVYTADGMSLEGVCTVGETLVTFVPYFDDGDGGYTAGGTMYFTIDREGGTFTVNGEGFVVDGTTLLSYTGTSQVVSVPSEVTQISANAFNYTKTEVSLVSVTVPAGVTAIGACAFENNYTLRRAVFLSQTPVEIDWSSANDPFRWPSGDFIIVVPEDAKEAYKAAWSDCPYAIKGSVEVTLLPEYEIQNGVLVRYNKQEGSPDLIDLTLPDEVTEIAEGVFTGVSYLRSIDLNNVSKVGAYAFENCSALERVLFTNVTEIGESAFAYCVLLGAENGTVELPAIEQIGSSAFYGCEKLKLVRLGEALLSIGDGAFAECHVYEEEEPVFIELLGDTPPAMGVGVDAGNIAFRIIVPDIEAAKRCYQADGWNKYCARLYIRSGEEKGLYFCGADTLELDGRAVFLYSSVWLYAVEENAITFYEYDTETGNVVEIPGTYENGVISFLYAGIEYTFTKVTGDTVSITSADGKYTLVCKPADLDPQSYENLKGTATVTFGGQEVALYVAGYTTKVIQGYTEGGKRYDIALTFEGDSFTYEMKLADKLENLIAEDGSVLNFRFSGSLIYVYGELKIAVKNNNGEDVFLKWSDWSNTAQNPSPNVYTFVVNWLNTKYSITVTVDVEQSAFTYSYTIL